MPEVEIDGIGTVVFPEDMSLADIQQESARLYDNHSTYATGVQPSALVSRQAQEMMPPSIREAMNRGAQAPLQQQITQGAARSMGPVYERNQQEAQMRQLQRSPEPVEGAADWSISDVADVADVVEPVLRPWASTPENPLGGFASAVRPVGQAINELGDEAVGIYQGVANSYGLQTGSVDREVVKALPGIAAAMTGAGTLSRLGLAESLAAPVAFGGVPFAQTLAATDDTFAALKAGSVGTLIPGTAEVGRAMAAKTLGSLVERGILGTGATAAGNMGQKAVEALGAQGAIQVFMEGMNLPEYMAMEPEERKAALLHNLAVNSAFLMMDVPGVFGRSTSRTREGRTESMWEAKKTGMKPAAKVGELLESLVNDPEFTARLTSLADEFALEQMNPRNAQLQAQAPEIANVEPRFLDPTAPMPTMGQEQRVVEMVAAESNESINARVTVEGRSAEMAKRGAAAKALNQSLKEGDIVTRPDGTVMVVNDVMKDGSVTVTIDGKRHFIEGGLAAEFNGGSGEVSTIQRKGAVKDPAPPESSEGDLVRGDRFRDGEGKQFEVWKNRQGTIWAHPVVDGKPVVNRESTVRFSVTPEARARNPEDRVFGAAPAEPAPKIGGPAPETREQEIYARLAQIEADKVSQERRGVKHHLSGDEFERGRLLDELTKLSSPAAGEAPVEPLEAPAQVGGRQVEIKVVAREGAPDTVKGSLVKVKGGEKYEWVAYKSGKFWKVVERTTGKTAGGQLSKLQTEAIASTEHALSGLNPGMLDEAINRAEKLNPKVREVTLSDGRVVRVSGEGAATYWNDPKAVGGPHAGGRFVLASPEFKKQIEAVEKAGRAAVEPKSDELLGTNNRGEPIYWSGNAKTHYAVSEGKIRTAPWTEGLPESALARLDELLAPASDAAAPAAAAEKVQEPSAAIEVGDKVTFPDPARPDKPGVATVRRVRQMANDAEPMAEVDWFGIKRIPVSKLTLQEKSMAFRNRQDMDRITAANAAEKVARHVEKVAAGEKTATPEPALQHTTGPRAAKEIKSELVQRIEEEIGKLPPAPELRYTSPKGGKDNRSFHIMAPDGKTAVEVRELGGDRGWEVRSSGAIDPLPKKGVPKPEPIPTIQGDIAAARRYGESVLQARLIEGPRKVTIEIPGDGKFEVVRTHSAMAEMLNRAKKLQTKSTSKAGEVPDLRLDNSAEGKQKRLWAEARRIKGAFDSVDDAIRETTRQRRYLLEEGESTAATDDVLGVWWKEMAEARDLARREVETLEKGLATQTQNLANGSERSWTASRRAAWNESAEQWKQNIAELGPQIERAKETLRFQESRYNKLHDETTELMKPAADSIDTGALGKVGMGGAKPGEFGGFEGVTSTKNATVDAERAKRGLPPAMEAGRRTWGEVWERAMAIIDQDPAAQNVLIAQLKAQPRALTDIEDALLLHRQIDLQNQYGRQTRELATAYDDAKNFPGRLEAVERFKVMVQETSKDLFELYEVGKAAGTETGRGLAARKMLADEHFELAQMEMEAREAREGAPLTDAERAELTQAHDTIKRLQAEFAAAEARHEAAAADRRAAEATEDLKQAAAADPDYNPVVIKWAERIVDKLERTGKEAEAQWKQMMARTLTGVDPTLLAVAIKIGAGKIARKAMPFAEWAQTMVDAVGESIRPYLQPAWDKLGERIDKVATDIAGRKKAEALKKVRVVDEDARRERLIGSITEAAGEDRPLDEIGTYVRRLALQFVKDGISDRNRLVDAVHSVLVNHFDPDITRREAMDAISGYGDFKPLDPDAAKRTLRDLKGQLQSVAKLEDIVGRRPLLKTGVERRAPSDEERRLIQQVNEAKRVHGVVTTDPARQLKGAQDAILTRLKHQIADLNFQIDAGARTVKGGSKVASTPEMDGLRHARNELRKRLDELLPRPGISEAQRIATAERGLAADIELYEFKIAARETGPLRGKSARLNSAKLDQLRARRDVLKAELAELRAAASPKLSPEERAMATLNRRIATEYAKVMDRIARSDYAPRRRREVPPMDAATAAAKGRLDQAKTDWRRGLVAEQRRNRSLAEKGWDAAKEVAHAQRQIWTSIDLSAVLRQGGLVVFAHPIRGLKSTPAMLRALSETQSNAEWAKVQARGNWSRYQRAKLYLSDPHETTITKLEEEVRSRWLQNVPGIKQSNQTYATFLNKLRADSFDAMVSTFERKGPSLTDAELRGIANYINIATGRGDFGKLAGAADTLAIGFFSPRLLLSRFQYIMGQPLYKAGSWRVRRQIAAEYARTLAGFAVVLALGLIAGAKIETDPTSSDFLKLKFGNTRVDLGAGILQPLVYLARTIRGEKKTPDGKLVPIRGAVPFGGDDWADVTLNFGRSKFSPAMGTTWDLISGKNVVGEKVTPGSVAAEFFMPLSFREVGKTMQDQGVPSGTVMRVLGLLGAGVDTYDSDEKSRKVVGALMKEIRGGTPEQREAIRQRLTEALKK